jgi:hypothetical protein
VLAAGDHAGLRAGDWIDGSATLTMKKSRTITKVPAISIGSASQRRAVGSCDRTGAKGTSTAVDAASLMDHGIHPPARGESSPLAPLVASLVPDCR